MMLIGLYTSRVILRNLGVTDYGIYNAVGGIVGMFSIISATLGNATSRFITIAIGKGNQDDINKTFGCIKVLYYWLCIILIILAETIGLWFLYHKMTIPDGRMHAALWVYQYSILSSVIGFICVPYNAALIAHEKMSAFAWISLLDSIFKLLICYLLAISPFDRLVTYSSLLFGCGIIDRIIYAIYCNKYFEEVKAKPRLDKTQFKDILTFSGWAMGGNIAWVLNTQGITLLLNMFFGPVVNAARGIAQQVQGVMTQFVSNFQTAINPQITKSYARSDFSRMKELVTLSSKYSYFLLLLMFVPVFIEAPVILKWWLVTVPEGTVLFLRITLISELIRALSNPLQISVMATGRIKKYQILDSMFSLLVLPIVYILFRFLNSAAYWAFLMMVFREAMRLIICIITVLPMIVFSRREYCKCILFPLVLVTLLVPIIPYFAENTINDVLVKFISVLLLSLFSTLIIILFIGLNRQERSLTFAFGKNSVSKFVNRCHKHHKK